MAGLFGSLTIATSGLTAARTGLDVTGQNIANVNTTGYVRRRMDLAEIAPNASMQAGRGVEVLQIRALRDHYLETQLAREQGGRASDETTLAALRGVDAMIGLPGESLDVQITSFFDAFSLLASDVTSAPAREGVVRAGQALGDAFNALSTRLTDAQAVHNQSIVAAVSEFNSLATRVAQLNARIVTGGVDVEALRDERTTALAGMAELANISLIERPDGAVDVTVSSGHALVVGANAYPVTATPEPPSGFVSLHLADFDVTGKVTGGRIGALIDLRDTTIPSYQAAVDRLAYDIATQVNAVHATGVDSQGGAGGPFFTPPASVTGAAATLSVSATVAADAGMVAASGTAAAGDNQVARAIAALRESRVMSGGSATAAEAWANIAYQVGSDISAAQASLGTREQIVKQLQRLRDQQSGVSFDEEAANLIRYQRSYEASARYFTTILDTLDSLMAMVR